MNQTTYTPQSFPIEYRGKTYLCNRIERNNSILYRVNFPNAYLYLTQGVSRDGSVFWTSIPEDFKLRHVVHELGEKISQIFQVN